ncbi:MAG: alkaline phosphatase D family protein [Synechococcaceae cyanobacterium ELA263]
MATWFSGVASGSATTTSGIFWTRAQNSASDNTGVATDLILELSDTADFKVIAFSKAATTTASNDYTIKTDLSGLKAGTSYFYRYRTTDSSSISDVGQFKTAPLASSVGSVTFGHSGDVDGLIAPYLSTQDLYKQKLDFFIFNGDTIYETASTGSAATLATKSVGTDPAKAAILLADYRRKYLETHQGVPLNGTPGTYQSLDNFFSAQGLYVALDNHELGNKDIINGGAPLSLSTAGFNGSTNPNDDVNLTGAYIHDSLAFKILEQAYLEYQPIRTITVVAPSDPRSNGTTQLYGSQQWGKNVVEINLDTRTYRDVRLNKIDPVTSARSDDTGSRADNPDRTLLGKTQLAWLKQTLLDAKNNGIVWKFINTSDPIDQIGAVGSGDDGGKSWMGGYRAERNDLLKFIADNGITNVMFLSSDDHQGRINEVLYVADPTKPTVYSKVPGVISMVDGPIGATGPDTVTDHTFANIKTLADALAAKQISNGVDPIGLDSNYLGLFNVWREGDPTASAKPSPVDFYSPDTFNYAKLEVTAEGVLNVALRGVDSYAQNSFPTPTDSNQPRDILRFSIDGLASQRTTAMDNNQAMLKPVVGNPYSVKPFFTFGTNPEYSLVGVPDGEGAYRIDSNTIRVLVNAEIGKAVGAAYTLDNGTRLIGARINFLDLNNAGQIKSGGVAYTKVVDRFGQTVTDPAQISGDAGLINGFTRFCSANLFEKDTFGAGKGFADRIFLMGEEDGNVAKGLGGSMCALDVDKGVLYQLGDLPYGSWEGATLVDTGDTSKVAIFLGDDATPSFPMLYVGNKSTDPKASFLERNGLTGGKVYVWAAKDGAAKDRPTEIFGTGTTVAGSWVELAIKDPSKASNDPATGFDKAGYLGTKKIHDAALALNAFACARIEDEDYNHASGKGNQVIFNATGQTSNGEYLDKYGTTYTLDTTFTNGLPGVATLKVVYDGDDAANRQNGIRSQDNIAWSADGYAYINEDRAVSSDADWGPQEGSVWKLDPTTGLATRILQIDRSAIPAGMTDSLKVVDGKNLGEWETSGVIDVSNLYGHAAGTDFFTDVQAHGLKDGPIATNNLVEGGQMVGFNKLNALNAPSELKSVATDATGYKVTPLFTFGESIGAFTPVGVPDGEGAFLKDPSTIRLLVNAEIGKAAGYSYLLANGTELTGARVQYFDIDKTTNAIKGGGVAYNTVVDRFGQTVTDPAQISGDAGLINGFTRFCSANLFEKDTFGAGKGFADRIFLMGEEDGNVAKGLGGSMCALDVDKGVLYQLGDLPYGSWEGATLVDTGDTSKVAIFLGDDATPSFPMLYVGNKSTDPKASFLERNGLTGGKVYVWAAKDGAAKDRPTEIFGTGTTVAGSWVELAIKDPSKASNDPATGFDKAGYLGTKKIHDAALALNAFACARIEDEDYNHASGKGNQVIFNATGQTSNGEYLDKYGTTYTLDTTFTNGLPGVATLKVVYDGDDAANRQNGIRSQDNIAWSADGYAYINEDRAVSSDADWGPQEGSVWKLDPTTGLATRILQIDRSAIPAGMTDSLKVVDGKNLGEWETSGVIDVSNLYGHAAGTDFFTDVQAHGLKDGPIATNNLVEGGQIIKFEVKDSTRRVDYTKVDNAVITPQFINVEDQLAGHVLYNRLPTAPTANNQPKGLQIGQTQIDFSLALDGSSTGNRARAFTDLAPLLDGLTPAAKRLAYFTFNTPYAAGIAPATPTAFTYDPTGKAGALFYDLDDNGTADKVGLMFVDGGNGDQDGKKNGVVAQSSTAGLASLNPIFAAANTVLKVADPTDPTSPGAVVIHASLGSRASTVNQIGYVALNGSESEAITFDLLKQRGTLLFATLEDSGVPDLSKMKFEEDIHLLNGQKLVFFEVVGNTLDKLLNKGSLDASFQILDVNKAGDSSATASKGSLSIKLNLGGDSSGLDALISNQMGGEATLLDFRGLVGQAIQGDVLVAREAAYTDTIRFYKVESSDGAVVDRLTNLRLLPGQPGYKEAALRSENLFTGFGPLSTDDLVNKSYQINPFKDAGLLAPYATVAETGETLFAFAQQNSDKLNHFRALGSGALGLEDLSAGNGKVDGDFDDVITYFNFSLSPAPVLA